MNKIARYIRANGLVIAIFSVLTVSGVSAQAPPAREGTQPPRENASPARPVVDGSVAAVVEMEAAPVKPTRTLDLSSPSAAMRVFLVAMQDAAGDKPERIDDAVACMDIGGLDAEDPLEQARALAGRLRSVIEKVIKIEGIKLEDLPHELEEARYALFTAPVEAEEEADPPAIVLAMDGKTGAWRFDQHTLASIPKLEKAMAAAAPAPAAETSTVAVERRSARATMDTFWSAMSKEPPDMKAAVSCLDPTGQDTEAWGVRGGELAHKLKDVMNKIAIPVLDVISDDPDGDPFEWYRSSSGFIVIARVGTEGELAGEWRFTPKTLDNLDELYAEFEEKTFAEDVADAGVKERLPIGMWIQKRIPKSLRVTVFGLEAYKWIGLIILVLAGWLIMEAGAVLVYYALAAALRRRKIHVDPAIVRSAVRSSGAVFAVAIWWFVLGQNYLGLPATLLGVLLKAVKFGLALTGVWVGYRLVDVLGGHIAADKEVRLTQFDDVLIPLLRKVLRLFVVLVVILIVLAWMGQPPTSVLGALGIGGVALAFAAKDTLGNFFGSITVLFDRPFGVGDWIVIGDIEGTVERVGFRSTRVRTFYNSMVTIPNQQMVNMNVDNYGARRYRRARIYISVTYDTPPDKIDAFCEGIRELIRLHPYTRKDYYHVYFNQFAASSLDILLYLFFDVPDWGTELRERHRLFVDIIRLANRLGVEFAFPTQTLWLNQTPEAQGQAGVAAVVPAGQAPGAVGVAHAAQAFTEAYGDPPQRRGPVVIENAPVSKKQHGLGG